MYNTSMRDTVMTRGATSYDGNDAPSSNEQSDSVPLAGDVKGLVIALLLSRVAQARVASIVGRDRLRVVHHVNELRAAAMSGRRNCIVIAEPRDAADVHTSPLLREIRLQCPAVTVIGFCPRSGESAEILALANAGVDGLIQEGVDDEGSLLRAAIEGSVESRAAGDVLDAIREIVPHPLLPTAQYCLRFPREEHTVEALAVAQGVDRKTLLNYARRHDFMPPSRLAMWCRLLLAAALLELTRASVESIAFSLDFASPSAFRNACRKYTGQKPSSWMAPGSLERVVAAFLLETRTPPTA